MSLRHDLIGMKITQQLREAARVEKAPLKELTPAQKKQVSKRAGVQGGGTRKVMAMVKRLFGGTA